jgi:putative sigma-54 modulation protein
VNINIKGTHIELTEAIKGYVIDKLSVIDRLLVDPDGAFVQVEVGKESRHHSKGDVFKAEINVRADGKNFYAVVIKDDLYAAIDELKDEVQEKIKSGKEKKRSLFRRGAGRIKGMIKGLWPWKGNE